MLEKEDREAADDYGPRGWIGGYVIGFILIALMFTLASGWRSRAGGQAWGMRSATLPSYGGSEANS